MPEKKISLLYRLILWLIPHLYRKLESHGTEDLPGEAFIAVGNHAQIHGPLACELYFPVPRYTWCAGEMMRLRDVPGYAFRDFWSQKPKWTHPFYKVLSYLIAPLAVCLFNNANCIGVYHDQRLLSTFKETVQVLQEGKSVVIFPEYDAPGNNIVYRFQNRFVDVARMYYRRTGREVTFVPFYVAPSLRGLYFGQGVRYRHDAPIEEERRRIADAMSCAITDIAMSLPRHTVVPYRNIPKRNYPQNVPKEETGHEKTDR